MLFPHLLCQAGQHPDASDLSVLKTLSKNIPALPAAQGDDFTETRLKAFTGKKKKAERATHSISLLMAATAGSRTHLEQPLEHDVDNLVLLIDVVQLHQVLERVQLIFPLGFKQPLV